MVAKKRQYTYIVEGTLILYEQVEIKASSIEEARNKAYRAIANQDPCAEDVEVTDVRRK